MCQPRKPHVHAVLICEWARGAVIEAKLGGNWQVVSSPTWEEWREYRIQPEPTDLERYGVEVGDVWEVCRSEHGYVAATVSKLTDVARHYRCTEGHIRTVTDNMALLFRRGEVNKL